MIKLMPKWTFMDSRYDFDDVESNTAIEQTARIYKKMQELITEYNTFVDEVNAEITRFETSMTKDYECFEDNINKIMHEYIMKIDEKIKMQDLTIAKEFARQDEYLKTSIAEQDRIIADAVDYMKTNIVATTREVVRQAIADGEISLLISYEDEVLTMSVTDNGGEI